MFVSTDWPGPDRRIVTRTCPNAQVGKAVACNCIGKCQPLIVSADDKRIDDEIREAYGSMESVKSWSV